MMISHQPPDFYENAFCHGAAGCVAELLRDSKGNPADARVAEVNLAFAEIFRATQEELVGCEFSALFETIDPVWLQAFARALANHRCAYADFIRLQSGAFEATAVLYRMAVDYFVDIMFKHWNGQFALLTNVTFVVRTAELLCWPTKKRAVTKYNFGQGLYKFRSSARRREMNLFLI